MPSSTALDRITGFVEWPWVRSAQSLWFLGAVLVGCPLALGGAPALTVPIFAFVSAVGLMVSGFERRGSRRDLVIPVMAAIFAVSALQLLPLPPFLLRLINPGSETASRWALQAFGTDLGTSWRALHLDPGTGLNDFVYFIGLCCMYLSSRKLSAYDEKPIMVILCAASSLVIALLAVIHLGTDQIKVYGVYAPQHAVPPILSPLLNANHLAALMGAGAILWTALAIEAPKGFIRTMRSLGAVVCGAVCALTLSRGGVATAAGAMAVFVALNARRESEDNLRRRPMSEDGEPRRKAETVFGAALGVVVVGAGLYLASTSLATEYQSGDVSKIENFRRALALLNGHFLFGLGSGGVTVAAANAGRLDPHFTFLRVESLPIDLALSFGVVVTLFALVQCLRAMRAWLPPVKAPVLVVGAWCAFGSLLVHDLVDFSLYLGGVGYVAAALAGALAGYRMRGWGPALKRDRRAMRPLALIPIALVGMLGFSASHSPLESDRDTFERELRARPEFYQTPEAQAAMRRHPSDAYLQLLAGASALARRDPMALRFVGRAMEISPWWAEPHMLLARLLAARGLRAQTMLESREALTRSRTTVRAVAKVMASLRPAPDLEELDRTAPRGPTGVEFLEALAIEAYGHQNDLTARADTVHLQRAPNALGALTRQASAALTAGDRVTATELCTRILTAYPRDASSWRCRAGVLERSGDLPGALQILATGVSRVQDSYPLHADMARIFAAQRNVEAMRRETDAMIELSGGDLQRRIDGHGARGQYESQLGNDRLAFTAYELGNALALPERPFLLPMTVLAMRLRDGAFVERACQDLLDVAPPDPAAVQVCQHSGRVEPDAGSVNPTGVTGQP